MQQSLPLLPDGPLLGLGLTVRRVENELAVVVELDIATAPRLDRVLRWLESTGRPCVLDLRDVTFVDCAGWRVVVEARRRHRAMGPPGVHLADMSRQVRRFNALYEQCSADGHR